MQQKEVTTLCAPELSPIECEHIAPDSLLKLFHEAEFTTTANRHGCVGASTWRWILEHKTVNCKVPRPDTTTKQVNTLQMVSKTNTITLTIQS